MNLHEIRESGVWFWVTASNARSGRIGTHWNHLWRIPSLPRPPHEEPPDEQASIFNQRYWHDPYYRWRPYTDQNLSQAVLLPRWNPPLCGLRTQSTRPRASMAYDTYDQCPSCEQEATRRGIMGNIHRHFIQSDLETLNATSEHAEWSRQWAQTLRERGIQP